MRIKITIGTHIFQARLHDTPTASAIMEALPIQSSANTWGDEIYFEVPAQASLETDAEAEVAVGDLAYWPTMPAFCIFFGPTPVSHAEEPRAASAVNVFGTLDSVDLTQLRSVGHGELVMVELV